MLNYSVAELRVKKTKCLILIKQTKDARITDKAQGIDVFYIGI